MKINFNYERFIMYSKEPKNHRIYIYIYINVRINYTFTDGKVNFTNVSPNKSPYYIACFRLHLKYVQRKITEGHNRK